MIQKIRAVFGNDCSSRRRGKKTRQCQPKGADIRAQLHPHPPPSATVAPRAPSRTSWTCCRYLSDNGSRETLISGSANQPHSESLFHGSIEQPPRHIAATTANSI